MAIVQLKRSAVPGAIPTVGQLALGELAINTTDGKVYIKKNVSGTESVIEVGAATQSSANIGQIIALRSGLFTI